MSNHHENITDCWNSIGVWRQGDEVCPQLASVIHCRNCSSYINAGLNLLDRELPEQYSQENAQVYKTEKHHKNDTQTSCLIFRIGQEWYAIKTGALSEINELTEIHSIPHNRNMAVDGLVNIRGEMEICISFAAFTNEQKSAVSNNKSRIVIINLASGKYAFQADEVMGIFRINTQDIKQPPTSIAKADTALTSGIFEYNETHVGLVDESCMDSMLAEAIA